MKQKGYISEFINGGRIVSHGKVENLDNGFSLLGLYSTKGRNSKNRRNNERAVLARASLLRCPVRAQRLESARSFSHRSRQLHSGALRRVLGLRKRGRGMIISLFISLSRRLRRVVGSLRKPQAMRLVKTDSIRFSAQNGKSVIRFK